MRRRALVPALLAGLALTAQPALTLPMALRQAASSSLQADLAGLARARAGDDQDEVRASFLPDLQLSGGHLSLDQDAALRTSPFTLAVPGLGSLPIPAMDQFVAQQSSWRYQLTASWLVYDFGKRGSALAAARARTAAVGLQGRDSVARAQAEVAARYMAVVDLRARRRVVDQRRQALQDHLRDARSLFDQGVVARNDVLRAELALRSVEDAGRALDNAQAAAREVLDTAMGLPPGAGPPLADALPPPPALPWDEAQVRARAPEANAGVQALAARVRAAQDQVAFRRRAYAPDLVAQAGHSYEENRWLAHPDQTSLYLGVSWKLFDGGARSARVRRSRSEEDGARRELLEASRQAGNAAAAACRNFRQALAEMATAQADVAAAQENLRIVTDQYQQAYAKGGDVLDAETVLAESRFSLSDRLCRAYAEQAGLLALLGEDLAAFYDQPRQEP